ncbi:hypothetical protein ACFE04_027591 [Oxalis oulophora]
MIGEIENRSTYLSAKEFINFLILKVETATFRDISDVEAFVKWLDEELSSLVDERAVLMHFPKWPEHKADALREAVFTYNDLQSLEYEVVSFQDNPKETVKESLKKMQALQDRKDEGKHHEEILGITYTLGMDARLSDGRSGETEFIKASEGMHEKDK